MSKNITVEFTHDEAVAVRFRLAGAVQDVGLSPHRKRFAQEALTKVDDAIAAAKAAPAASEPEAAPAA